MGNSVSLKSRGCYICSTQVILYNSSHSICSHCQVTMHNSCINKHIRINHFVLCPKCQSTGTIVKVLLVDNQSLIDVSR